MLLKGIAIFHTHSVTLFRYISIAMRSIFQYPSHPIQLYRLGEEPVGKMAFVRLAKYPLWYGIDHAHTKTKAV